MIGQTKRFLTPVLGAAALLVSGSLAAQEPTAAAEAAPACTATITPQALKVQDQAFHLQVALPQQIGEPSAVTIQEEGSGVVVALAQPKTEDEAEAKTEAATEEAPTPTPPDLPANPENAQPTEEPAQVLFIDLNASAAQPGAYTVQLQGPQGTCTGQVTIAAGSGSN